MKHILSIIIFLTILFPLSAQENEYPIKLLISSRVDTSSKDVKAVIKLYEDYYNSTPDSIYDNPYWNKSEKELYSDFDFSRESIFQGGLNATTLFQYYSPFVMSVEAIGAKYQIRVLFSSPTTDPAYAGSKVWCIQKLNAIKENEVWEFENLIVELSKNWSSKQIGFIEYIYPPAHSFDIIEAEQAEAFCNEMIQRFNPNYNDAFRYYVTSSTDDMGLLENFDYYFVGVTAGKAREGMIITAKGNEYYPHELVHKLLPFNPNRGTIIEEGLAVFLGTKEDQKEYDKVMNKLATDLYENPEKINFKSVLSQKMVFNDYQMSYPAGAGICELIYESNGDLGLIQLIHADTETYDEIVMAVCTIMNLTEQELEAVWYKKIINFL
jgi:hypothetical protein